MSSASPPSPRRPLHQRSESQNNRLAIRIVPYSPPRPVSVQVDTPIVSNDHTSREIQKSPIDRRQYGTDRLPSTSSTLRSSHTSTVRLVPAIDNRVSASKRADGAEPSAAPHRQSQSMSTASRKPTTPTSPVPDASHTPSPAPTNSSHISLIHASAQRTESQAAFRPVSSSRAPSRRRHRINVHSDTKTFSLEPQSDSIPPSVSLSLSLSASSSFERLSSAFSGEGRPSSPMTTLPDRSFSPCTPTSSTVQLSEDPIADSASSPWNYQLVGGLRKVSKTPDPAPKQTLRPLSSDNPLPTLLEATAAAERERDLHSLLNKSSELSFGSLQSASTDSETTNYKVYNARQPVAPEAHPDTDSLIPPSTSDSNYEVLDRSSPCWPTLNHSSPPKTASSDNNYVVHGDPSSSSPLAPRSAYSHESLIVPPLRPGRKNSIERFGLYKTRSKDSLTAGSLTSISSIIAQEAIQTFFAIPIALQRPRGSSGVPSRHSDSWDTGTSVTGPSRSHMASHPHVWSSQLSTVISESEGGSEPVSRSVSALSGPARRNSGFYSNHSRQMLSISSSLAAHDQHTSGSQSLTDSLERPQPSHCRGGTVRLVRDQDEHGDGLADLHELHQRPSRRRLSSFMSSTSSSDRNIHSSGSSQANSMTNASLPTWARLYYGSGERRWLRHGVSSESMTTDYNDSGRSRGSFRSGSPSIDNLSLNLRSPRRRPREVQPSGRARRMSDTGSMEITSAPVIGFHPRSSLRKQTSSIWSPHLGRDQRASGYSIWEPPSVSWSVDSSPFGRRNVQVVMFILGFILPIAWMVAAFLPLPPLPYTEMVERAPDDSSMLDIEMESARPPTHMDEICYRSARWWRNLNRIMALVGVLIVAVIVTLAVVGAKHGWGHPAS
ncbi:uncharacterized protein VDAG_06290 [Verticillium dahliae VdLs.17]|uniref:Serine-rich protein n=3 Tax=Verticillium dahliae TaxID=27337 RepID=G2X732_VERDV|nr:uncharacterized protein VDAG_06290 [Verticillium dahliae VdLs.17]EGY14800.1 hypothetical protein VDAG_06290 [Verticillium dahliae VdLs.17]